MAKLPIPQMIKEFYTNGYTMSSFKHTLVVLGKICDDNCTVICSKTDVPVFSPENKDILAVYHDHTGAQLWRFALRLHTRSLPPKHSDKKKASLSSRSEYDLPSVEALVSYLYAAEDFNAKSMWLAAIKAGKFETWPGLTYSNSSK